MDELTVENENENEETTEVVENAESTETTPEEPIFSSIDDLRNIDIEAAAESAEEVVGEAEEEPAAEAEEYTPDFTYKVKDEVLEFDENLKAAVTSKESEELLRDLYTRSRGLDSYKTKNSELETKLGELEPQLNDLVDGYRNIKHLRDSKDYHRLIKTLNWSEDDVIDFAEKLLEESEMPEDQRKEAKANRDLEDRVQLLSHKVESYESQQNVRSLDEERNELATILSNDIYAEGIGKLKEVGLDFEQDVIAMGTQMFNESDRKVYPQIGDVVAKAYELRQPLISKLSPQEIVTNQEPVQPKVIQKQPTLPKVTGTNNNAIDEGMSLDKLRSLSDQIPTR